MERFSVVKYAVRASDTGYDILVVRILTCATIRTEQIESIRQINQFGNVDCTRFVQKGSISQKN